MVYSILSGKVLARLLWAMVLMSLSSWVFCYTTACGLSPHVQLKGSPHFWPVHTQNSLPAVSSLGFSQASGPKMGFLLELQQPTVPLRGQRRKRKKHTSIPPTLGTAWTHLPGSSGQKDRISMDVLAAGTTSQPGPSKGLLPPPPHSTHHSKNGGAPPCPPAYIFPGLLVRKMEFILTFSYLCTRLQLCWEPDPRIRAREKRKTRRNSIPWPPHRSLTQVFTLSQSASFLWLFWVLGSYV